jgi:small subunit ribosomal protein S20
MPILKNAKKALRSSQKKAVVNGRVKSKLKTMVDRVLKTPNPESLSLAFSAIDKAVKGNLIHTNKAARFKSRLTKLVQAK